MTFMASDKLLTLSYLYQFIFLPLKEKIYLYLAQKDNGYMARTGLLVIFTGAAVTQLPIETWVRDLEELATGNWYQNPDP